MAPRMHHDQTDHDADLVRRLLEAQRPEWAHLSIEPVVSTGTDNAMYRLGHEMVVRLPLRPKAVETAAKECRWMPALAPHLPLPIPVPLYRAEPAPNHPGAWPVLPWLDGADATAAADLALVQAATGLASFIAAMHGIGSAGGPVPSQANFGRGVPLADRDDYTRTAIEASRDLVDVGAVTTAWEDALRVPPWDGPP